MRRAVLTLRREDGRIVCESVVIADKTGRRMRGLLGRRTLASNEGIALRPAWSIHTWFMRFPIDVVFLDPEQVVVKIESNLSPFKTSSCRGAREIVELAAGECDRRGLQIGDRVAWAARPAWEEGSSSESVLAADPSPSAVARHGAVIIASGDQRFVKLVRFLLDGRGIDIVATVPAHEAAEALAGEEADVLILDAGAALAGGLRLANAARAARPETAIVLVAESTAGRRPAGITVLDKWNETEQLTDEVERAIVAARSGELSHAAISRAPGRDD